MANYIHVHICLKKLSLSEQDYDIGHCEPLAVQMALEE